MFDQVECEDPGLEQFVEFDYQHLEFVEGSFVGVLAVLDDATPVLAHVIGQLVLDFAMKFGIFSLHFV